MFAAPQNNTNQSNTNDLNDNNSNTAFDPMAYPSGSSLQPMSVSNAQTQDLKPIPALQPKPVQSTPIPVSQNTPLITDENNLVTDENNLVEKKDISDENLTNTIDTPTTPEAQTRRDELEALIKKEQPIIEQESDEESKLGAEAVLPPLPPLTQNEEKLEPTTEGSDSLASNSIPTPTPITPAEPPMPETKPVLVAPQIEISEEPTPMPTAPENSNDLASKVVELEQRVLKLEQTISKWV